MNNLQHTSFYIPLANGHQLFLKRYFSKIDGPVVFMLHGSVESGSIFYSRSHKGLAPWLAMEGYDVYVGDMRGKGGSTPAISKKWDSTQLDVLMVEIPAFLSHIQKIRPNTPIMALGHSWGGVLLLAYEARTPDHPIQRQCFLGTKRSIAVSNWRKIMFADLYWAWIGSLMTLIMGYLPAKALKMGSENEPASVFRHCRTWVRDTKKWIDPSDGLDYRNAFKSANIPPTLYLTGKDEHFLGHPDDVKRLMAEVGNPSDKFILLSKANGNLRDYGHIDICTYPQGPSDHFPMIQKWFDERG